MRRLVLAIVVVVGCRPGPSLQGPTAAVGRAGDVLGYRAPPRGLDATTTALGAIGMQVASALRGARGPLDAAPAMALTPSDGSELAMRELGAEIQIRGPLAHTELHATFHNAEPRVREGRFTIALPATAAVSRFAMKVDGVWREARVVSRTRGREVYEGFLHRRVDPALLERDADNRFSARVFPIAAGADKEIIIAYDHAVGPSAPYVLPLRGLPAMPIAIAIDQDGESSQRASRDAP
ncbi:MAG TPA: VIT domain-containing protein, partial [Kofleriaceae bacterium]